MTNAKKYLKDDINLEEFAKSIIGSFFGEDSFSANDYIRIKNWSEENIKPTLSEDERVILKNIDLQNFRAIGRKDDYLYLRYTDYTFEYGDVKTLTFWYMYHNLFKFINEGEEYSIEELLQ